jgi:hypothetical protein
MERDQILPTRLHRQHLAGPPAPGPLDVVRTLAAMQAQEYLPAKWSIAQRTTGADDAAIEKLGADGAILRTHVLRPTWHFALPEDLRMRLIATAPRVHQANSHLNRRLGLADEDFARSDSAIAGALGAGTHLTRAELGVALSAVGFDAADGLTLAYLVMHAELEGIVCSGARRGKQHTYALLDERAPHARVMSREDALAEMTLRYFTSRGPATATDLAKWATLTLAEVRQALAAVGSALRSETVDGRTYWFADGEPPVVRPSPTVDLVQSYDEMVMGYFESRDVLSGGDDAVRIIEGPPVRHVVLVDGVFVGGWRMVSRAKVATVETFLRRGSDEAELSALAVEAERFGAFLGSAVSFG